MIICSAPHIHSASVNRSGFARHMALRHFLLLVSVVSTANCSLRTSYPYNTFLRKLARDAASDQQGIGHVLEQLLSRKAQIRQHVQSEAFMSHLHQQHQHYNTHPADKQGILIVAGGRDMFANTVITIMTLRRHLKSQVPVEIVHFGPSELPPTEVLAIIHSLNATGNSSDSNAGGSGQIYITDALQSLVQSRVSAHHKQMSDWKGFPAKAFALAYATRFQQVLLLDADSLPLVDPILLLEMPAFQKSGNIFWPDFWWNAWVNHTIYSLVGGMAQPPWEGNEKFRLVDSGQILFDRLQHAEVLEYIWLLNSHHEWVYKHMHGDKDTFLLAFAMAGRLKQFKQVQTWIRDGMTDQQGHKHRYHHLGAAQSVPYKMLTASVAKALSSRSTSKAARSAAQRLLSSTRRSTDPGRSTGLGGSLHGAFQHVKLSRDLCHAGVPVMFHRTSFNSKFFPDCLESTKIKTKYCEVQYLSVPLTSHQAGHSLKQHMYAFDEHQVKTTFYEQHCKVNQQTASGSNATGMRNLLHHEQQQHFLPPTHRSLLAEFEQVAEDGQIRMQQLMIAAVGLPPEWNCDKLTVGDSELPLGAMPVQLFTHLFRVLQYSYEAFREVRERLKA